MPRLSNFTARPSLARWWPFAAAAVSGLLLVFAFEPFNHTLLAWIALAPLLYVLTGEIEWKRALVCGWLAGVTFFFFSTNWITHSMIQFGGMAKPLAYGASLLFSSVVAFFPSLFAVVMARLVRAFGYRALLLAPFVWVATEWLRGSITGATWNALGISLVGSGLALWARIGGVYLLSGVLVLASALLVCWRRAIPQNSRFVTQLLILSVAVLVVSFLFSTSSLPGVPISDVFRKINSSAEVSVAAVQPDIPLSIYDSPGEASEYFERTLKLTRDTISQARDQKPELIIWAESPLTLNYEQDEAVRSRLDELVRQTGAYLIFSAIARNGEQYFNSAQTIAPPSGSQPVRQLSRYDKIRLVPFGEYVPFRFVLGYFVPAMVGDFAPGRENTVNSLRLKTQTAVIQNQEAPPGLERTTNFARIGTFICYEAAYPNLVRQFVRNGATLLINISNDAWFGNTAGARQHLAHARMRAIENNRDLVRVTNSGISALITADGRVVDQLPMFTPAAKIWQAHLNSRETFYTRYGDWFPLVCTLISLMALISSFVRHYQIIRRNA